MAHLNPVDFNQAMLDRATTIHNHCMEHVLDEDQTDYNLFNAQREQMIVVCKASAKAANAWSAHINRFNTHRAPFSVRIANIRSR